MAEVSVRIGGDTDGEEASIVKSIVEELKNSRERITYDTGRGPAQTTGQGLDG